MFFNQAAATAYLTSVVFFAYTTAVVADVFCTGGSDIDVGATERKSFSCPGTTNGQVRIFWETRNNNAEGFDDDE